MAFDKNIPIPPIEQDTKKTFAKVEGMEVGESILHPYDEYGDFTLFARLKASANHHGRRSDTQYEARKMEDGIRIWRVK